MNSASATLAPSRPDVRSVWILTAQIKKMGPNITLWAIHTDESGDSFQLPFLRHDRILGESRLGPSPMTIIENPRIVPTESLPVLPEYRFIRRLGEEDETKLSALAEREKSLLSFVRERATARDLPMLFMDAVGNFAANDFLLYYTAEGRIDFRDLLKDIHGKYRGRVELRQISPREYTSILDGIGACGKTLCCSSFLKSFKTISTKMAREAESEPNSMRSTGMCGRLKCCLSFEGAASSGAEPGGEEGSCCSKKSKTGEEEWVPHTDFSGNSSRTPPPRDGGEKRTPENLRGPAGPRRTEIPVSRTENRYRKDSHPRG
jgi:cell fate regulator YaaT (PSP1 superfamily)